MLQNSLDVAENSNIYTVDFGFTPVESTGGAKRLVLINEDHDAAWAEKASTANSSEVTKAYSNTTSDRDRTATCKRWARDVKNIYANSRINSAYWSPVKSGKAIGTQFVTTLKVTDTTGAEKVCYLPFSATVTMTVPDHPAVDKSSIEYLIAYVVDLLSATDLNLLSEFDGQQVMNQLKSSLDWVKIPESNE